MVGLSEALSFPFVVERLGIAVVTFRRFDEIWQELGPMTLVARRKGYLRLLARPLRARASHCRGGRSHKILDADDRKVKTPSDHISNSNPWVDPHQLERWRIHRQPASSFGHTTFKIS